MSGKDAHMRGVPAMAALLAGWAILAAGAAQAQPAAQAGPLLRQALAGPWAELEEVVFAARVSGTDHYYVNFGYYVNNPRRKGYQPGGRLCRLNVRTGELTVILEDAHGGIRDPQLHYDGRRILFSYRPGRTEHFHLYEIDIDGSHLRQLTDGPHDDIEPTYTPGGEILFSSSRCNRTVACWYTPVSILYACDGDGGNIRALSSNIVHENTPWMLPDGRVLYTRWEYVDRSRTRFHHLWTINPDGTGQMTLYGNLHGGTVMIDAKPIPGTRKVVCIFSPGHGRVEHQGMLTVVDPDAGPDERSFARRIGSQDNFRDPYPLSEDLFLVARGRQMLLVSSAGDSELLYELPEPDPLGTLDLHEPRPLAARPREPVIPSRVRPEEPAGRLVLADATYGRNTDGVPRGQVRKLLVLEQLPKPVNFSGGMEPTSLDGTFTLKRILGTVPVEPDGSAHLEVPALRSVFFVALDEHDLSVKRMQSFLYLLPGETSSCAGCHEHRNRTPRPGPVPAAAARPPSRIEPIAGVPEVFDFPRDIQPILDRHCLKCHDYGKRAGGVILSGDRGTTYSHAYHTLLSWPGIVSHGRDGNGNRPPRTIGSSASKLMTMLDGSHHRATLSEHERTMIRLWIETGAVYAGTYAALGTGMTRVWLDAQVLQQRCNACHQDNDGKLHFKGAHRDTLLYNLTRPEQSLALLAPLAKEAGGYGLCRSDTVPAVFADTGDADYRKLLVNIGQGKVNLDSNKRYDMEGFRPNQHYLREMQRIGILPPGEIPPSMRIDPFATDEAYWRSFWYVPPPRP